MALIPTILPGNAVAIDPAMLLMYQIIMCRAILQLGCAFLLMGAVPAAAVPISQPSQLQSGEESAYGTKFFDQLRDIFGRFRESDLQRVFREAQPVQCSELVARKGEWRPVAFFNENRSLGDWCRESLQGVKTDLAVYTFKGVCQHERDPVRVGTEFPTEEGIEGYKQERISLEQVDIIVNEPVNASLNRNTMAYTFDLPYLFVTERAPNKVYSFRAPGRNAAYATDVSSRWECKAVSSRDVTYRFLICRVSVVPQRALAHHERWEPSFGSSAFFILSDGTEARTSVNMTFGDEALPSDKPADAVPPASVEPRRPPQKRK